MGVSNAGITGFEAGFVPHDPDHASLEDWRSVLATNLDGVFLGCKHAIRAMRPQGTGCRAFRDPAGSRPRISPNQLLPGRQVSASLRHLEYR
jgi:NAD(P)-dependent dehydrogenase (short-subunit alcohol dehydrogenase family)